MTISTKTTSSSTSTEEGRESRIVDSHLTPDSQTLQELELPPNTERLDRGEDPLLHKLSTQEIIEKIEDQLKEINELLAWKEDLKLLSLHATINEAYDLMWQREINPLVKRSVILKRRLKQYQASQKFEQESDSEEKSQ